VAGTATAETDRLESDISGGWSSIIEGLSARGKER
jgi:hypothetical protein